MSKKIKRPISIFTSVTTVLWLSGVAMLAPMAAGAAVIDGDIVSPDAEFVEDGTTYYPYDVFIVKMINGKTFKRLVLNPEVFESYGHLEWGNIQTIDASTVEGYTTSDLVYPDNDGDGVADGAVYKLTPDGDTGTRQHLNMTAEEFTAAGYDWDSVYVVNSTDFGNYTTGSDVTDGDTTVSEGTLTVSLAADTPASGYVINGSIRNSFTTFNATATGGDVIIDSMTIKRVGVGQDNAFTGVNIVNESTNRTVSETDRSLNSSHMATVSNDVTIKSGETKKFTIVGSMTSGSTYAGEAPALQLEEIELKDDASLSSNLPIVGNTMTINGTITLGTLTVQRGSYTNASTTTSNPTEVGKTDLTVFSVQIEAPSDENVDFSYMRLYNEGSADLDDDLDNIALYNALTNEKLADGEIDGNYIHFNIDDAVVVEEGQNKQFKVVLDVVSGSERTIKMEVYRNTDLLIKGQTHNAYFTPTYSGTGSGAAAPYLTDNEFTIGAGTFTVRTSGEVGSGNIAVDSDQELGAFLFDVEGEPIEISAFTINISSSTSENSVGALKSVKLVDASGNVVAGPNDHANGSTEIAWTDTFTVPVGENAYKVLGTLASNKGWSTDDTITVQIAAPSSKITAEGSSTGNSITSGTTSTIEGNQRTVKGAYLSVSRNSTPGDRTVIVGSAGVELGAWTLDATNAGEDIRITQLKFAGRGQSATNTSNQHVWMDGEQLDGGNPSTLDGSSSVEATTTFTFSDPIVIPVGETKIITLKADKDSTTSDATEQWGLTDASTSSNPSVVAYGKDSGVRATTNVTVDDGATITSAAAGSLDVNLNGAPAEMVLVGGTSEQLVNKVNFKATNSDIEIQKIYITVDDGNTSGTAEGNHSEVDKVYLKVNGSYIGSSDGYAVNTSRITINLDPDEFVIPSNEDQDLEIYADIANVSNGSDGNPGDANACFAVGIAGTNSITAIDSTNSSATISSVSATSSNMTLHKSKPLVTLSSATTETTDVGSNKNLFQFDITAQDNDVAIYRLSLLTSTSNADITLSSLRLKLDKCSNCMVGAQTVSAGDYITAAQNIDDATDPDGDDFGTERVWSFELDNQDTSSLTKEALEIPSGQTATIQLIGSFTGLADGSSISTYLLGDDTATSSNDTTGDYADNFTVLDQGNFVWSDLYSDDIGSDVTTTKQWYNGYLIDGADHTTSTETHTWTNPS